MCGIVGYVGMKKAAPILMEGLRRLEYRGYDSAGIAVAANGSIGIVRSRGKLANLRSLLTQQPLSGPVGLGHTRWATHGEPSEANAHPHTDCTRRLAVIHNGIIENYVPLKAALQSRGHVFRSQTDTEVIAHLIEEKFKDFPPDAPATRVFSEATRLALKEMRGAYALAAIWAGAPDVIVAAKNDSPLVIGLGDNENFLASDVPAFLRHTRKVVFLEDGELAILAGEDCSFFGFDGRKIEKSPTQIDWDSAVAEKGGYRHFMFKEIHEQPATVENTLRGRLSRSPDALQAETGVTPDFLRSISQINIVACGTAYHAGIIGKYLFERYARIPTHVETASEFRYREPLLAPGSLIIAISQSGETADTLAAVRLAAGRGAKVLAVCNTIGSALTRCADFNFYTRCGPECGVASTKAFLGQLIALNLLAIHFAAALGGISEQVARERLDELTRIPKIITAALALNDQVLDVSRRFFKAEHFLYIGRTFNYPTALEGALKLKEISYIHAEGYPAGEMKHGPLALVDSTMPVLAIATQSNVFEKILSNIEEARARGAKIISLCTRGERRLEGKSDYTLELPAVSEALSPIVNIVPLQLLAYHISDLRGCDVDQPRNLAKSVTVE